MDLCHPISSLAQASPKPRKSTLLYHGLGTPNEQCQYNNAARLSHHHAGYVCTAALQDVFAIMQFQNVIHCRLQLTHGHCHCLMQT
jgi:hypothetical protein